MLSGGVARSVGAVGVVVGLGHVGGVDDDLHLVLVHHVGGVEAQLQLVLADHVGGFDDHFQHVLVQEDVGDTGGERADHPGHPLLAGGGVPLLLQPDGEEVGGVCAELADPPVDHDAQELTGKDAPRVVTEAVGDGKEYGFFHNWSERGKSGEVR